MQPHKTLLFLTQAKGTEHHGTIPYYSSAFTMNKKHHFLLFRHCVRSVGNEVDMGHDTKSSKIGDYIGVPLPKWGVPSNECTVVGNDMVKKTGHWLINSETIVPDGAKIKWEIIADDYHRDVDTAYYLKVGIQDALDKKYGDRVESVGLQDVHIGTHYFERSFCEPTQSDEDWLKEVQDRLENLPRPPLSFPEALQMVEQIMGRGKRSPMDIHPIEPEYDPESLEMIGAAPFRSTLADILLFSQLSDINPRFAPIATVEQVCQLVVFHSWYRSVEYVGSSDVAVDGGLKVEALLRVLRKGHYLPSKSSFEEEQEDYDTRVTIILGHDDDLEPTATALGATWKLKEPFISDPNGDFLSVPPMSGIHAVRDVTTEQVDVALLYPNYFVSTSTKDFNVDRGGSLLSVPLLFTRELPFSQVGETSTSIQPPPDHQWTGVDILEEHTLQVLAGYHERATECYRQAVDYWVSVDPEVANESSTSSIHFQTTVESKHQSFQSFLLFIMGVLAGWLVLTMWNRRYNKRQQWRNREYVSVHKAVNEKKSLSLDCLEGEIENLYGHTDDSERN